VAAGYTKTPPFGLVPKFYARQEGFMWKYPSAQDGWDKGINKSDYKCRNQCANKGYTEQAWNNKLCQINYYCGSNKPNQAPALGRNTFTQQSFRNVSQHRDHKGGNKSANQSPSQYKAG
jgi:hypothetical protein